jgi:signal transduction histidine kinase
VVEVTRTFTTSVVRWALVVRLVSTLVALVMPMQSADHPRVVLALALLGGWSLVWLAPRGGTISVVQRHPLIAVGDALIAVTVTALVGVGSPLVFATLSTALVIGVLFRPVTSTLVTGVLVAGYVLVAMAQPVDDQAMFAYAFVIPATYVVLALLGGVTRHLHEQVLVEQGKLASASAEAAGAAERARLARDMHDSVAKSLHGVALAAAALPRWIEQDPQAAVRHAAAIQRAAEQASLEARELLVSLRTVHEGPLVERLTDLVAEFRTSTGLPTELEVRSLADLDPGSTQEVLHVVAEALENVRRHAGPCTVAVDVNGDGDEVAVRVGDDGAGFDPTVVPGRRYGVVGMRERAVVLGGTLDVDSTPGEGTLVTLRLPLVRTAVPARPHPQAPAHPQVPAQQEVPA